MLTADQLDRLREIHRREFDRFDYEHDITKWLTPEYWVSQQDILAMGEGRRRGDCDDYALIVRAECRPVAIPTRLVFCWVPPRGAQPGGYHLGVESCGWFSDCNHPHLIERDLVGYVWISLSGYEPGDPWHYIKGFDPTKPWPHQTMGGK